MHSDEVHIGGVIKRLSYLLKSNEKEEFTSVGNKIKFCENLEEGMKQINKFFVKYMNHPRIGNKMNIFRDQHWIKHTFLGQKMQKQQQVLYIFFYTDFEVFKCKYNNSLAIFNDESFKYY